MQFEIIPPGQLTSKQRARWRNLQQARFELRSPFLSPEFVDMVADVRDDIFIAVGRTARGDEGYLPFQKSGARVVPVGIGMNEWQALLAPQGMPWDTAGFLRAAEVRSCRFDHLVVDPRLSNLLLDEVNESPYLALREGYDAFLAEGERGSSQFWKQMQRKRRKLAREVGPLRFELHDTSEQAMPRLLEWKQQQHQRTGVLDIFQYAWVTDLLKAAADRRAGSFCGSLSGLWAGDRLLAVHLGLIDHDVAHVWYPTYDAHYGKYSPGILLFLELIRELCARGVNRLDFGPGPQSYKERFRSGQIPLAVGTVDRSPVAQALRSRYKAAKTWVKSSALAGTARFPAALLFRYRQWRAFR